MSKREFITYDQAVEMLPEGDTIHTFRGGIALIGADWSRGKILEVLKGGKPELAGEVAQSMGHGLVVFDNYGPLFIETK